jgi:hypothetical protein
MLRAVRGPEVAALQTLSGNTSFFLVMRASLAELRHLGLCPSVCFTCELISIIFRTENVPMAPAGLKWPEREIDYSPSSSVVYKNARKFMPKSSVRLHRMVLEHLGMEGGGPL